MADQAENLLKTGEISSPPPSASTPPPSAKSSSPPPPSPPLSSTRSPKNTSSIKKIARKITFKLQALPPPPPPPPPSADPHRLKRLRIQNRVAKFLVADRSNMGPGDVELTLASRDGFSISMGVHRSVLTSQSRYFAEKLPMDAGLADSPTKEFRECDDVELFVEVVIMMYCRDLRRRLAGEKVLKILGLLKVSLFVKFDAGVSACLYYIDAVPWTEDEEKEVIAVVQKIQLDEKATQILQRVSIEPSSPAKADPIFLKIMACIIQGEGGKVRRDMKGLLSWLVGDYTPQSTGHGAKPDVFRETLYHLCHQCLDSLRICLSEAASMDVGLQDQHGGLMGKIALEAGNVQWLLEILIRKQMGDEFVKLWADQREIAALHSKVPCKYRYEISGITAQLCITLGNGQILVGNEAKSSLLWTWLEALCDDFGWLKRASSTFDKKMVENGLCETILMLPMAEQQAILFRWFDCFLEKGDDWPNIQRAFKVWCRRAFFMQFAAGD